MIFLFFPISRYFVQVNSCSNIWDSDVWLAIDHSHCLSQTMYFQVSGICRCVRVVKLSTELIANANIGQNARTPGFCRLYKRMWARTLCTELHDSLGTGKWQRTGHIPFPQDSCLHIEISLFIWRSIIQYIYICIFVPQWNTCSVLKVNSFCWLAGLKHYRKNIVNV